LADVLFVGVNDPEDPDSLIKHYSDVMKESENATEEPLAETAFDKYKQAQETALTDIITQLKQLKRDSIHRIGTDVHVLFSDVKEAPAHMSLIQDKSTGSAVPGTAALLNPTIRFLRFGQLYNERTNTFIRMSDALQSPQLQQELNREADYVYSVKYRPTEDQMKASAPMENFVKACVCSQNPIKPHLESTPLETASKLDAEDSEKHIP